MKKIIALVLALAMVATLGLAFAEGTNNRTADNAISITGLDADDVAKFYKVLDWSENATKTGGWVAAEGVTLNEREIQKILGLDEDGKPAVITDANRAEYGINSTIAAKIANQFAAGDEKFSVPASSGTASVTSGVEAGLYCILVTPGKAGTVYNPVFVGADYERNDSHTWNVVNMADSYSDKAMAKKDSVTLEKTAKTTEDTWDDNKPETLAIGDRVTFTVTSRIPQFADNYTHPKFFITDTLDEGLDYDGDFAFTTPTGLTEGTDYTLTLTDNNRGFVLNFTESYLKGLNAATPVTITYKAKLNEKADVEYNVNEFDNTVTVNFSNNPADGEGHGVLKDKTKHYSFSIDGKLFGNDSWQTSEVVKVGLDEKGEEITETKKLSNTGLVGALQNAEFKLYTAQTCNDSEEYDGKTYKTDETGHIVINGLDAGTYWLKETKAPDGYIKAQDPVKVKIEAVIEDETYEEDVVIGKDGEGNDITQKVTYTVPELKSYTVTIGNDITATATLTNESTGIKTLSWEEYTGRFGLIADDNDDPKADDGKILNTKGVELPSTGGIGTTIFYILGGLLVIGAAVILVARRKAQD